MSVIRMLGTYISGCDLDEHLQLGKSAINGALDYFCDTVILQFEPEFLCSPKLEDMERIWLGIQQEGFHPCLEALTTCIELGRIT